MRCLGYGIGHKGQTKSVVPSSEVNHSGSLRPMHRGDHLQAVPPLGVPKAGAVEKVPNMQEGDQDSSEDESDGESEVEPDDEDDMDGCL